MPRTGEGLVLSPTDLTKHLGCAHIRTLDAMATDGLVVSATGEN